MSLNLNTTEALFVLTLMQSYRCSGTYVLPLTKVVWSLMQEVVSPVIAAAAGHGFSQYIMRYIFLFIDQIPENY